MCDYASAAGNATNPILFEPFIMSILLAQQKRILAMEKKLGTTPKIRMKALSRRCVGFGAKIVVWFRCSLSKLAENGSKFTKANNSNAVGFNNEINSSISAPDHMLMINVFGLKKVQISL